MLAKIDQANGYTDVFEALENEIRGFYSPL